MNSDRQTERKITQYRSKALKGMASTQLPSSEFRQKLSYNLPNLINRAFVEIATKNPHCSCSSSQWQERAVTRESPGSGGEGYSFCPGGSGPAVSSTGSCSRPGAVQGAEAAALHPPRLPGRLCPAGGGGSAGAGSDPGTGRGRLSTTPGCFVEQEEKSRAFTPERSLAITQMGQLEGNQ